MNIQEFQSKILMQRYGLNVQRFKVADTPAQAATAAKEMRTLRFESQNAVLSREHCSDLSVCLYFDVICRG